MRAEAFVRAIVKICGLTAIEEAFVDAANEVRYLLSTASLSVESVVDPAKVPSSAFPLTKYP